MLDLKRQRPQGASAHDAGWHDAWFHAAETAEPAAAVAAAGQLLSMVTAGFKQLPGSFRMAADATIMACRAAECWEGEAAALHLSSSEGVDFSKVEELDILPVPDGSFFARYFLQTKTVCLHAGLEVVEMEATMGGLLQLAATVQAECTAATAQLLQTLSAAGTLPLWKFLPGLKVELHRTTMRCWLLQVRNCSCAVQAQAANVVN